MNEQYIKELEDTNESLQERLTKAETTINILGNFNRRISYFSYRIMVLANSDWLVWADSYNRPQIFTSFTIFKDTLNEYKKISVSCSFNKKITPGYTCNDGRWTQYSEGWNQYSVWCMSMSKEKKKFIIDSIEVHAGTWGFFDYNSIVGDPLEKHLHRWSKI